MQVQTFAQTAVRPTPAPPRDDAVGGDAFAALHRIGARVAFAAGQEIFGEGEPADGVYRVLKGAVRSYRLLGDGRRQICDFHLEGDIFGLEAGLEHRATAEALSGCVLLVVRRGALAELAHRDHELTGQLWRLSLLGCRRSQDHALILARQGAAERVAAFLAEFAARVCCDDRLELPMSRQDIADYLGLTIHTVSRTLSQLQGEGVIEVAAPRQVRLSRPDRLAELCA